MKRIIIVGAGAAGGGPAAGQPGGGPHSRRTAICHFGKLPGFFRPAGRCELRKIGADALRCKGH